MIANGIERMTSETVDSAMSIDRFADDVAALIDHINRL